MQRLRLSLLVPQRFDRIEKRRLARRIVAKENADNCGEGKCHQDRRRTHQRVPLGEVRNQRRCGAAQHDADDAANERQRHGFNQELRQYVLGLRPHRLAQANLPGPLRHRHQHDVHDSNAAHDQRYRCDRSQQNGHHPRRTLLR